MPRKSRFSFDPDNTTSDGHYIVGKGRPPEHSKFKKGDGRPRGRRPKGTRNLATDLREELDSRVTVTVGGVPKKVSRQRAIVMRLTDNATKGQNSAIALALEYQSRVVAPILEREEQQKSSRRKEDFSLLTYVEMHVLTYLLTRSYGEEDNSEEVIGVIPIVKQGSYINAKLGESVCLGLRYYGVEVK